jgi:hypothetical protein
MVEAAAADDIEINRMLRGEMDNRIYVADKT